MTQEIGIVTYIITSSLLFVIVIVLGAYFIHKDEQRTKRRSRSDIDSLIREIAYLKAEINGLKYKTRNMNSRVDDWMIGLAKLKFHNTNGNDKKNPQKEGSGQEGSSQENNG